MSHSHSKIVCTICQNEVGIDSEDAFGMLKIAYFDPEEKTFIDKLILCQKCQTALFENDGYENLWGEMECR